MRAQITVTPAKAGVHFKPWGTWIPAFAGMTTECGLMMKGNFEIAYSNSRKNMEQQSKKACLAYHLSKRQF